jgi:hypothetical protein
VRGLLVGWSRVRRHTPYMYSGTERLAEGRGGKILTVAIGRCCVWDCDYLGVEW